MNKYQESMENEKLTSEARERILKGVVSAFEDNAVQPSTTTEADKRRKNAGVLRVVYRFVPVAAAAAAVIAVMLSPFGQGLLHKTDVGPAQNSAENGTMINGNPSSINNTEDGIKDPGQGESQNNSFGTADDHVIDDELLRGYKNGKITIAECTASSYVLGGKSAEEFIKGSEYGNTRSGSLFIDESDLGTLASVEDFGIENGPLSDEEEMVISELKVLKENGLVTAAYYVKDDVMYYCSFSSPADPDEAAGLATRVISFMLRMDTNGQ